MTGDAPKQGASGPDVFVSCASQDVAVGNSVVENLEQHGIRCWIAPRDVTPGSQYADEIVGAINDAKVLVLVLSEHAIASPHVGREVERAASKRRRIVTLRTDATVLTRSFEYFLSESQWIDVAALGMPGALTKLTQAVGQGLAPSLWVSPGLGADASNPADRKRRPSYLTIRRAFTAAVFLVAAAIVIGVGIRYWPSKQGGPAVPVGAAISDKSIAVLPFADMSEKKDQEYFADGLSEELVNVLGKLPNLRVIAHSSSFHFRRKSDDAHSVGAQLGAANIVVGSVRRAGNHVRVTARLIRSSDGVQEWSGSYDRSVDDILQVQTEIASSLGRALQLSVPELQSQGLGERPSAEAYDLYLRGLQANDRISSEGFDEANSFLQRAIELDPRFVRAHEELASTHLLQAVFGAVPADTGFGRVRDDAANLLKLDPDSGWGQTLLCRYHTEYTWDWAEAERECAAALTVAPRFWLALYAAADLALIRGDYTKSERLFKEIFPMDPLNADTYMELGLTLRAVGRFAEAETAFRHGLSITPTYITGHLALGSVLLAENRIEDARQAFELESPQFGQQAGLAMAYRAHGKIAEATSALGHFIQDHGKEQPMIVAGAYSYFGDADHAFDWLDRAYRQHDPLMPYVKGDWLVRNVEGDPRYKAFLKKMKLSE